MSQAVLYETEPASLGSRPDGGVCVAHLSYFVVVLFCLSSFCVLCPTVLEWLNTLASFFIILFSFQVRFRFRFRLTIKLY